MVLERGIMMNIRGLSLILFFVLSCILTDPIGELFSQLHSFAYNGYGSVLALLTTVALYRVFVYLFPNQTGKKDRLILSCDTWCKLITFLSVIILISLVVDWL